MTSYTVTRDIGADAGRIWSVLTDASQLDADFGIVRVEGAIAPGQKIKLWSELDPKRAFGLRVTRFEPGVEMIWQGGVPLGLFTGTRRFTLAPNGTQTRFTMTEAFSGLMSGLITKSMPDLQPSFEKFADALTARVQA